MRLLNNNMVRAAAVTLGVAISGFAQTSVTQAKGIYTDTGAKRLGVKFNILLERDGERRQVPTNYKFRDGDRMLFQLETNKEAYVYVLNRTVQGDPDTMAEQMGAKGVRVERRNEKPKMTGYRLLFPNTEAGKNNKTKANQKLTVPGAGAFFKMDDEPGVEKLYVVASERPVDIARHFNNPQSGSGSRRDEDEPRRQRRDDTDDDVTSQLSKELEKYADNADVALADEKGIGVERSQSYGIGVDGSKPMVVEINLRHYAR